MSLSSCSRFSLRVWRLEWPRLVVRRDLTVYRHHLEVNKLNNVLVVLFQIFFEGVEARVSAGVKREEVGFQLAFSKTELRKVIKEYPGKEVSLAPASCSSSCCSVSQLQNTLEGQPSMCSTHTRTCTSAGTLHRVRG